MQFNKGSRVLESTVLEEGKTVGIRSRKLANNILLAHRKYNKAIKSSKVTPSNGDLCSKVSHPELPLPPPLDNVINWKPNVQYISLWGIILTKIATLKTNFENLMNFHEYCI